ncbi:MmgE/PrpD family protein [Geodermatophilus sp. SYSU D00766]
MSPSPVAPKLVDWAWRLRLDDVPADARAAVARHLLDGLGTAIAAGRAGAASPAVTVALGLGGPPESTVLGSGARVGAPAAALANGVLLHALDFDDTHAGGLVHATAVVLPAALAVGEQVGATGADVLLASVAGLETVCRLGAAAPHAFHARGLHATAVCGVFSAALVAARLGGLDRARAVDALGIAGSSAGGLLEFLSTGSATKQLHPGLASQSGILAARLAAAGASGPASVLEGGQGVYAALAGRRVDPDAVLDGLGERWECTRITVKPHPACQLSHAALDAAAAAAAGLPDGRPEAAAIASVVVDLHPDSAAIVAEPAAAKVAPRTPYEAKFSVQWSVAALLVDRHLGVQTYAPASLTRAEVADLAARVSVRVVDRPGVPAAAAPGAATIRLTDGTELRGEVPCSAGSPERPLDDDGLLAKAAANAGGPGADLDELARRVRGLAGEPDLARVVELADRLARPAGPAAAPHPEEDR